MHICIHASNVCMCVLAYVSAYLLLPLLLLLSHLPPTDTHTHIHTYTCMYARTLHT